jgi:hypothetical protein
MPPGEKTCQRCGVVFKPDRDRVIWSAPCKDCRETGRREGDTTVWGTRYENKNKKRANA